MTRRGGQHAGAAGGYWAPVVRRADLVEGCLAAVEVAGHPVVLAVVAGRVYAADGRCPHRGALLTGGRLEAGTVRCPLHGFRYDLRTGESVWPPGWEALPTYPTRVADGVVYVWVGWEPVWPPATRANARWEEIGDRAPGAEDGC